MRLSPKLLTISLFLLSVTGALAQRTYKAASVLSSGTWYRIGVTADGVYKIDAAFLNTLGITGSIPSSALRIFTNGGGMLPEANSAHPVDDLEEIGIQVVDGGDGQINGQDYVLFYGQGPDRWEKDSANLRFIHRKNLYSGQTAYFVTVGGTGKRVQLQQSPPTAGATVTSFSERYFHELDTVNFLSSGKEWFGEEFSNLPGRSVSRTFTVPYPDQLAGQQGTLITSFAARSINAPSSFTVLANGSPSQQAVLGPVSAGIYDLFAQTARTESNIPTTANPSFTFIYSPGSFNSQGWLNWFEYFGRRSLNLPPLAQLNFRDWLSVGTTAVEFALTNTDAASQVWDVTEPFTPVRMATTLAGNTTRFSNGALRLREYVCFSSGFLTPLAQSRVQNQNLHSTSNVDFIIIAYPDYITQAQRLAAFHQQRSNLNTVVVSTDQVFNEFSGGIADPTAIRDFLKMYFDRYGSTWTTKTRSALLFGKASFDYRNRLAANTNQVPGYETRSSVDPLSTYTSDDFYGFLEDHEDINATVIVNTLDLGLGRIPAKNAEEAKNFVDKVLDYHAPAAFGPWRNNMNLVADDEDQNLHLQDAESLATTVNSTAPVMNLQKIYLDAFQQEGGSAGGRYPQANAMVDNNIFNGTLIWNYSGHGGPLRLAEEVVIDQPTVNRWSNQYRLPLFITATCDFAPFDNPTQNSLGENLLIRTKTGAIALMTTTRVVFAFSNRIMNDNYLKFALQPNASGQYKSLGEAMMTAKNFTYLNSGDITNNRKFTLLGDPAMTLAFPTLKVKVNTVNGRDISVQPDTLSATEFVSVQGAVTDAAGTIQSGFNGTVYLSVFDKQRTVNTLANDAASSVVSFSDQSSILFKGKASVTNGQYTVNFRVPRDINFQYGNGKLSLYADDGSRDANGYSSNVVIGSIAPGGNTDVTGPEIKAFLNDDKFVNGSITNTNPVLLLKLFDSSGINTGSSGIDHDIVATLDNNNNVYYVLNNFYESDLDNYQKGQVRFQLPEMSPGNHVLKIKAWDVMNNSSEYLLNFIVVEGGELRIEHVLNYPNPFTTKTSFWFEHNRPATDLYTKVEIFTVSGKLIKSISQTINTPGNRSSEVNWDGTDDYGKKIGRGVYIYRLYVRSVDGKAADKWERLVIL